MIFDAGELAYATGGPSNPHCLHPFELTGADPNGVQLRTSHAVA
jgi:hypothetical protein